MTNILKYYNELIVLKFLKKYNYSNFLEVPKLKNIVINSGLGLKAQNKNILEKSINEIRLISGLNPIKTYTKKAISNFKTRKNTVIGLKVTLRHKFMYCFLEKFVKIVLPRIRDFQGLSKTSFDQKYNFHVGIKDQLVFPEIDFEAADQQRGFNISFLIKSSSLDESLFLLQNLGFLFRN